MRKLEFRIWDGRYMEYANDLYFFEENSIQHNGDHGNVVMQSTGQTDKNGQEIYESDIVKNDWGSIGIIKWGNYVEENGDPYCDTRHIGFHSATKDKSNVESLIHHEEWEIIGNIYENAELLKEL